MLKVMMKKGEIMRCQQQSEEGGAVCNGPVKPEITFFEEALPQSFRDGIREIKNGTKEEQEQNPERGCDLLIVLGTALAVAPFNSLADPPYREED